MLRSERMSRVTVTGDRRLLVRLVHVLQSLGCVQLIDGLEHPEHGIGRADAHSYFPVEGYLVALRSIKEYLQLAPPRQWTPVPEGELILSFPDRMEMLAEAVREIRHSIEQLQARKKSLEESMQAVRPFETWSMDLSALHGAKSLRVFALNHAGPLPEFDGAPTELDAPRAEPERERPAPALPFKAPKRMTLRLLAVETAQADAFQASATRLGVTLLPLPPAELRGNPAECLRELAAKWRAASTALQGAENERKTLAAEWNEFIHASEEALVSLLAKSQGSTGFCICRYGTTGSFWVPSRDAARVMEHLRREFPDGLDFTLADAASASAAHGHDAHGAEDEPAAPTALVDSSVTRPFRALTTMFGIPRYDEIDPTPMLTLFFPVFFGFMIGDVGYGLIMAVFGYCLRRRFKAAAYGEVAAQFSTLLWVGGIVATLFGFFVFADAFGIPFHEEHGMVFWWGSLIGMLPHPILLKTEGHSVNNMLILSVLVGWLQMSVGCAFGIWNEWRHSVRHVIARVGQLLAVSGFSLLVLGLDAFRASTLGGAVWSTVLAPVNAAGTAAVIEWSLLAGIVCIGIGEGAMGLLEIIGLFGNVVSYTRLALIGVSKAAVAIAVNSIILPQIIHADFSAGLVFFAVLLVVLHLVLVILGCLSASIQSVRLHYCETFAKFFKGGGVLFQPFGMRRVFTCA